MAGSNNKDKVPSTTAIDGTKSSAKGSGSGGSEIDDIFSTSSSQSGSSKSNGEGVKNKGKVEASNSEKVGKKKEGGEKRKSLDSTGKERENGEGKKRKRSTPSSSVFKPKSKFRTVEIITDTSSQLPTHTTSNPKSTKVTAIAKTADDLNEFTDSRGTSGRKRTEDGLRIFTAAELRLGEGQGDTPDCPFDCHCCY